MIQAISYVLGRHTSILLIGCSIWQEVEVVPQRWCPRLIDFDQFLLVCNQDISIYGNTITKVVNKAWISILDIFDYASLLELEILLQGKAPQYILIINLAQDKELV